MVRIQSSAARRRSTPRPRLPLIVSVICYSHILYPSVLIRLPHRHEVWHWAPSLSNRGRERSEVFAGKQVFCARNSTTLLLKQSQLTYAFQIIYGFALVTARLSILSFYHRLFPRESAPRWWRTCLYIVTFFVIGWFIAGLCCVTFICTPISYYWTRTGNGHCINEMAVMYLSAAITIVADILILLLPLPVIWNLHMRRSKKIGVMTIFLLGGL